MKHHPPHRSSRSSRSRRLRRVTCHLYQSHGTCLGPYLRLAASLWKATNGRQVRQLFLKRHPLSQNRYLHSAEHTYSDVSNTWNLSLFEDNAGYTADLKDNKDTGTDGQHFGLQVADDNAITYHLFQFPLFLCNMTWLHPLCFPSKRETILQQSGCSGTLLLLRTIEAQVRILVIEDNSDIAANLGDYLEERGHAVDFAADGVTGLHLAVVHEFDAIVLDLNLPGMDGIEVCRKLRNEARKQTPVLMLTARDSLDNKLTGFDSGADDYLIKPFALQEVEVRLNALSRRGKGLQTRVLETGDLEYNLDTLEVRRRGKLLQLNPTGLKILQALMEATPAVVTRQDLETRVWGEELPDSDSLRVHIHGLRAVVDKPFDVPLIQTRHGIGYRIATPDA